VTAAPVKNDAELIDEIASELNRLSIKRIDPEAFFVERNDLVWRLRRLAARLAPVPDHQPPMRTWKPAPAEPAPAPGFIRRRTKTIVMVRRD